MPAIHMFYTGKDGLMCSHLGEKKKKKPSNQPTLCDLAVALHPLRQDSPSPSSPPQPPSLGAVPSPALPSPCGAFGSQLGLQPAEPQWRGTGGWQHTALIRVYTQTISSCSRNFAFRPSSSGHRPVTGQAGIWLACTRGLQILWLPTSFPSGDKAIMLTFMER